MFLSDVGPGIGRSLFADDGALWKRGRNIKYTVSKVQEAIEQVERWSMRWGFRFSKEKTQVVLFTRKKINLIKLYGHVLEKVESFRFLGIVFDARLTWAGHIEKVIVKCKKVLNVMRCLTGVDWGASRQSLREIYVALIKSVIDYGCIAYRDAARTTLTKLEVIQTQALRICSGAFRTSPAVALQVEMGEMPLHLRREQLAANYWANLQGHAGSHPTRVVMQVCWEHERVKSQSFGWVCGAIGKDLGLEGMEFSPTVPLPVRPPWLFVEPIVDLQILNSHLKSREEVDLCEVFYNHLNEEFNGYLDIYTDGSKDPQSGQTGAAFGVPKMGVKVQKRLSDQVSVFTVELMGIWLALQWIEETRPDKVVICSDSSAVLKSLQSFKSQSRQDIVYEVLECYTRISQLGVKVKFTWVPAHIGVKGNEMVDGLAKQASKRKDVDISISISKAEAKTKIWMEIMKK